MAGRISRAALGVALIVVASPALAQPVPRAAAFADNPADFDWIDRADALWEAIGDAPPDYAFAYDGAEPWAWETQDGHVVLVEEAGQAMRSFYFAPGDKGPFLVVEPGESFGFEGGRLAMVYGPDGTPAPRGEWRARTLRAMELYDRGRALRRAAGRPAREAVDSTAWVDSGFYLGGMIEMWSVGRARPGWRRHRDQWDAGWRHRIEAERLRRRALAEAFRRWRQGGFQGPPPGHWHKPGTPRPGGGRPPHQPGQGWGSNKPPRPGPGAVLPPMGPGRPRPLPSVRPPSAGRPALPVTPGAGPGPIGEAPAVRPPGRPGRPGRPGWDRPGRPPRPPVAVPAPGAPGEAAPPVTGTPGRPDRPGRPNWGRPDRPGRPPRPPVAAPTPATPDAPPTAMPTPRPDRPVRPDRPGGRPWANGPRWPNREGGRPRPTERPAAAPSPGASPAAPVARPERPRPWGDGPRPSRPAPPAGATPRSAPPRVDRPAPPPRVERPAPAPRAEPAPAPRAERPAPRVERPTPMRVPGVQRGRVRED